MNTFDRTYEGLKRGSRLHGLLVPREAFDRTYEGLKQGSQGLTGGGHVPAFDRTYEGLKPGQLIRGQFLIPAF